MSDSDHTLDIILLELGQFGKYQCFIMTLFSIALTIHAMVYLTFIFSAKDLAYRCYVPECDLAVPEYNPSWLQYAIPYEKDKPLRCARYRYRGSSNDNSCNESDFDRNLIDPCDDYVYKTKERSIVNDLDIHCNENQWKLTAVGTVNSAGLFVGLPVAGFFSDKYGRKITFIVGLTIAAIFGLIKSFATSYVYFVTLEFIDTAFRAGVYSCAFILGVELVGPKGRVLAGTIVGCSHSLGGALAGITAWGLQSWRSMVRITYGLCLICILYYWLTPESVRWLLARKRYPEVKKVLKRAAKINGKTLTDESLENLCLGENSTDEAVVNYPIRELFKSVPLILRFVNSCFCWITCAFLFYGFTINSVALSNNSYLDFTLTTLVEIPGYSLVYFVVDRFGRRICLCSAFLLTSTSCVAFIFIPPDFYWGKLTTYLLGKFGVTMAFSMCYIITSEIFPTNLRHSLLAFCSMFGRIGSMISPQMPLLEQVWKHFPLTLYAIMATIAALLSLLFPETVNTKLPDTIKEAENIGRKGKAKL